MWSELITSGAFWSSAGKSYVINLLFGISINAFLHRNKPNIAFLDGLHDDMVMAFTTSAFFCGLLTPLFSSFSIHRKVQTGAVKPPDATAVVRSYWSWLLRQRAFTRSLFLAVGDALVFGLITLIIGGLTCSGRPRGSSCELQVWTFLVVLVAWSVPVQVETSLLNYAATAHCSRRLDTRPLVEERSQECSSRSPVPASDDSYLEAAVKMSDEDASEFMEFFSKVNPDIQQKYTDLCRENDTLDEFVANPLVFILANNPQCCAHIAREYVDSRSSSLASNRNLSSSTDQPA
mmetsp:Transcript_4515/g.10647  ORF Transcript_4515/g.10647 Transcript_4515/m.10647 type:complete len:291 (-) Transcript_4515:165-1037(-)